MKPSGIEPATCWIVVQYLNQLRSRVSWYTNIALINYLLYIFYCFYKTDKQVQCSAVFCDVWEAGVAQSVWLGYRLESPGFWILPFSKPSRRALGPKHVPSSVGIGVLSRGSSGRDVKLTTQLCAAPTLRMSGAIHILPLYAFMSCLHRLLTDFFSQMFNSPSFSYLSFLFST